MKNFEKINDHQNKLNLSSKIKTDSLLAEIIFYLGLIKTLTRMGMFSICKSMIHPFRLLILWIIVFRMH